MKNNKLNGSDYLVLNHDIAARKIDRDKAVQALAGLRLVAEDLGLPGKYLLDSIERFLNDRDTYPTLDSAFGLAPAGGGRPQYELNEMDAEHALNALEQRLSGSLAKAVSVHGVSDRRLRYLFQRYLFEAIRRARQKRVQEGFTEIEANRLEKILARGRLFRS